MTRRDPMRLLLTADTVGGVWQYAVDLAAALPALNVAPTIATIGPAPSAAQRAMVPPGVPLIETALPLDWLAPGPEPVLAAGRDMARLAGDFDLVQLNMPSLAAQARFPVPTVAVAHGCLSTWWEAAEDGPIPASMAWQVGLTRDGLRRATAVAAPTRAFGELVQRHYGLTVAPVPVHNGRRSLAGAPGAAHDHVFTAGRLWDRAKNVRLLDEVAGRLAIPFFAAGASTGPHGETVALKHLHPLGILDEEALIARLRARPVFVSAARFEPFGLAVLEAAQAGCPLVLSNIATFRELWDGAALFVAPDDANGFVVAIERIIGDAGLRRELGQAAEARARRYTPHATAAAMAALYARLLASVRKAAA